MITFRRRGDAIDYAQCEADRTGVEHFVEQTDWDLWSVKRVRERIRLKASQLLDGVASERAHSAKRPE